MLRTFAPHLNMISNSCLEDVEAQYGALSMAAAAVSLSLHCTARVVTSFSPFQVEIALTIFKDNGTFVPPSGDFDITKGGGLTDNWVKTGVMDLHNKENRWNEMMEAAYAQASLRVGRSRTVKKTYIDQNDLIWSLTAARRHTLTQSNPIQPPEARRYQYAY